MSGAARARHSPARRVVSPDDQLISEPLRFSARPEEFRAREERRHEAKHEVLGHSKQAEFVRLMEQEVALHAHDMTCLLVD